MKVKIQTMLGDIVVRLYDETPIHRDNFLKLAKEGYYDGTLFHRVIKNFMIQGVSVVLTTRLKPRLRTDFSISVAHWLLHARVTR